MRMFTSINEIDDWLLPLDYEAFWEAIAPYGLGRETRALCDEQIQLGVHEDTVLGLAKLMARWELAYYWGLEAHLRRDAIRLVVNNDNSH